MLDLAAFFGRLFGTALNPVLWVIIVGALALTKSWPPPGRVATTVAATFVVGAAIYLIIDTLPPAEIVRGLFFAALIAGIVSTAWVSLRRRQ